MTFSYKRGWIYKPSSEFTSITLWRFTLLRLYCPLWSDSRSKTKLCLTPYPGSGDMLCRVPRTIPPRLYHGRHSRRESSPWKWS